MIISKAIYWPQGSTRDFLIVPNTKIPWISYPYTLDGGYSYVKIAFPYSNLVKHFDKTKNSWTKEPARCPGEFLLQGGYFDRYKNTSVTNLQWNIALADANDFRLNPNHRIVGYNPNFQHGSRPTVMDLGGENCYLKTDEVDVGFVTRETNKSYTHRGNHARTHLVRRKDACCLICERTTIFYRRYYSGGRQVYQMCVYWRQDYWNPYKGQFLYGRDEETYTTGDFAAQFDQWRDYDYVASQTLKLDLPDWQLQDAWFVSSQDLTKLANPYSGLDGGDIDLDIDFDRLYSDFLSCSTNVEYQFTESDKSDVCSQIMDQINLFDSNLIAYAKDLPKLGDSIRGVLGLVKDWKNPAAWASAWLSLRFGDRLTIADTSELISSVRRASILANQELNLFRARKTVSKSGSFLYDYKTRSVLNATIALSGGLQGDMENLLAAPYRWDLLPTLQNIWDLVPFSFVVDWVYNVEEILSTIDKMSETRFIDIKTQYASQMIETELDLAQLTLGKYRGSVTRRWYHRGFTPVDTWLRLKAFTGYFATSVRPANLIDSASLLVQSIA